MNAPLVPVTLAFLTGILCRTLAAVPAVPVIGLGAVGVAAALGWRRRPAGLAALLLLWACLGLLRMAAWSSHPDARLAARIPEEPQPVRVHAVVANDPTGLFEPGESLDSPRSSGARSGRMVSAVEPEPARLRAVLRLRHRRTDTGWTSIDGRILATVQEPREPLAYGDELLVEGEWSRVPSPGNPGEYDRRTALARHRIHGQLRVKPFHGIVLLRHHQGQRVVNWIACLRHRWEALLERRFHRQDADLLRSLLLGQRRRLDPELQDAFLETGTVHLLPTQMGRKFEAAPASHVTI